MARVQHTDVVIGAGAGVVVNLTIHGTTTPATLWAGPTGETTLSQLVTNEYGFYSVWLDEGEYDESVPQSPQENRVLSILSYQSLKAASEVKEGKEGKEGKTGATGATGAPGEPGSAVGGYQTGDLRFTALPSVETGWLACDGSAVSRTGETKALFEAIGTAYGAGNGTTTFNLPDLRGRSPMGSGKGEGGEESEVFPERTRGAKAGRVLHKLVTAQLAKHGHTATDSGHSHSPASGTAFFTAAGGPNNVVSGAGITADKEADNAKTASAKANVTNTESGSGEAHPNVHPVSVCSAWIKK